MMMSMLSCMMLIAYAEDNNGDEDTYGDNNDNDNVAPCCPCCYVTFETPPIQKLSCFLGFLDKNFATDPPKSTTTKDDEPGICDTFTTTSPTNKTRLLWKNSETSSS